MGMKPLVSIISPCYNGGRHVSRLLDSILAQTHSNIEMICVNDGSTDNTEQVIRSYADRFSECNICLKFISQPNQGQAAALNNGLKHVNGDYLCWIDCDDFITPDSIASKLSILERNPEFGICTSDLYIVDESDIHKVKKVNSESFGNLNFQRNQFYLTIIGLSAIECHGHMIRMSYFDRINHKREINRCREGQNYQILLPMYYYFPRIYVDRPLGHYVIRNNSHYHSQRSRASKLERLTNLLNMLEEVLIGLNLPINEVRRLINISFFSNEIRRLSSSAD